MAEHRIPKNNVIYVIPDDNLYLKYKSGEAFIDEYGSLVNIETHRVFMVNRLCFLMSGKVLRRLKVHHQ